MIPSYKLYRSVVIAVGVLFSCSVFAAETESQNQVLFSNVKVFDGLSPELSSNTSVLVEGNLITSSSHFTQ